MPYFFSNGIHLNILENSKKQGEDGWSNINAINDLIKSIIEADEIVTVASFSRGAGAGGVFLGLACDYVVARDNIVINPHYKILGLSGSEYHTCTLPKKVGKKIANKLLNDALHEFCKNLYNEDFIWSKQDFLEKNIDFIEALKRMELSKMYPEFWNKHSEFHKLRHEFVYKICPFSTPQRIKGKLCMNIVWCSLC